MATQKKSPTERKVQDGRVTKLCPICGRGIIMDHNLSDLNYDKHVDACPKQQMKARRAAGRRYIRKLAKAGKGTDVALPGMGQLALPFVDGVPREVGG
jgi:hypothetical protein